MMAPHEEPGSAIASHDRSTDRLYVLFSLLLFLIALALTNPIYEMGFQDDWSYTHIARQFAYTGHLVYNGHTAVMLIPQILWAALFIRLFGFSFLIMRISTMILAAILIPVLYKLARISGLKPSFALFATLLTALSPLVLPCSATYLSDVPAFFFFVLSFYGAVRAWKAEDAKKCALWSGVAALMGVLSGLDRQIYWAAPILFLPVIAWVQRRSGAVMYIGLQWLAAAAVILYSVLWFQAQPYILAEHTIEQWRYGAVRHLTLDALALIVNLLLTAGMLLLPVLIGFVGAGLKSLSRSGAAWLIVIVLAAGYMVGVRHDHKLPNMGNIVTEFGIQPTWTGLVAVGSPKLLFSPGFRHGLTLAVIFSAAACFVMLWKKRRPALWTGPAGPALILGLVFAAAWLPLLVVRSVGALAYDRYLIAFFPLVAIPLLWRYQTNIGSRFSGLGWATLAVFSLYGVATTHDAFAQARARSIAARHLEEAGIPRTEINGGFEYNGWTQLETVGYVNAVLMEKPAGAYKRVTCNTPDERTLWSATVTPSVQPRYFVVIGRFPGLVDGPFPPVEYAAWLPAGKRQIVTQLLPGGGRAECH